MGVCKSCCAQREKEEDKEEQACKGVKTRLRMAELLMPKQKRESATHHTETSFKNIKDEILAYHGNLNNHKIDSFRESSQPSQIFIFQGNEVQDAIRLLQSQSNQGHPRDQANKDLQRVTEERSSSALNSRQGVSDEQSQRVQGPIDCYSNSQSNSQKEQEESSLSIQKMPGSAMGTNSSNQNISCSLSQNLNLKQSKDQQSSVSSSSPKLKMQQTPQTILPKGLCTPQSNTHVVKLGDSSSQSFQVNKLVASAEGSNNFSDQVQLAHKSVSGFQNQLCRKETQVRYMGYQFEKFDKMGGVQNMDVDQSNRNTLTRKPTDVKYEGNVYDNGSNFGESEECSDTSIHKIGQTEEEGGSQSSNSKRVYLQSETSSNSENINYLGQSIKLKYGRKQKHRIVNSSLNFGKKMLNSSHMKQTRPADRFNMQNSREFSQLSDRTNEQPFSDQSDLLINRIESSPASKDDCSIRKMDELTGSGSSNLSIRRLDSSDSGSRVEGVFNKRARKHSLSSSTGGMGSLLTQGVIRMEEPLLIEPIMEGAEEHNDTRASNSQVQSRQRTPEKPELVL